MEQRGLRVISQYFEALAERSTRDVLYRGHANENWELMPSVFRRACVGIDNRHKLERWMRLAMRFATPLPRHEAEWLVMAQHFGVPTPMLDWTMSPLVALFFACNGEAEADGCVWQVRTTSAFNDFHYLDTVNVFRKDRPRPGLVYAVAMNARSLAQDSAMSLHSGPDDRISEALIRKVYTVNADDKPDTLGALSVLGFTKERLFSDIGVVVEKFLADVENCLPDSA